MQEQPAEALDCATLLHETRWWDGPTRFRTARVLRSLVVGFGLALLLAACASEPVTPAPTATIAAPTSTVAPAFPSPSSTTVATATSSPPTTPALSQTPAESATPSAVAATQGQATVTMVPPLVPAFPTSTVAFSGAGPLSASMVFLLRGATYHVNWSARPISSGSTSPTWSLIGKIHDSTDASKEYAILNVTVSANSPQEGVAVVENIPEGTYVLQVDAAPTCSWIISIHP